MEIKLLADNGQWKGEWITTKGYVAHLNLDPQEQDFHQPYGRFEALFLLRDGRWLGVLFDDDKDTDLDSRILPIESVTHLLNFAGFAIIDPIPYPERTRAVDPVYPDPERDDPGPGDGWDNEGWGEGEDDHPDSIGEAHAEAEGLLV